MPPADTAGAFSPAAVSGGILCKTLLPCLRRLMARFQIVRHDLPLIHVVLHVVDLLIGLVALAAQDDDIVLFRVVHGPVNGLTRSTTTL